MKLRHLLMVTGLAGAASLAIFGDRTANLEVVEPLSRQASRSPAIRTTVDGVSVVRSSALVGVESRSSDGQADIRILPLYPRAELMVDAGEGRNGLFDSKSWIPPPPRTTHIETAPAPTAPPLPFTYLGKQTRGGQTQVFLASGDKIFIAHDQEVIQNNYRVESINAPILLLRYLPLNQIQQLAIGVTN